MGARPSSTFAGYLGSVQYRQFATQEKSKTATTSFSQASNQLDDLTKATEISLKGQ